MGRCAEELSPPQPVLCRLSYRTRGLMGGMIHGFAVPRAPDSSSIAIYGVKTFQGPNSPEYRTRERAFHTVHTL